MLVFLESHCKNLGIFLMIWDNETLPGPATMIDKLLTNNNSSSSKPPCPVKFDACFTWKIAPSMTIDNIEAEILVKAPIIKRIPGTSSPRAIKNCISAGIPIWFKNPTKPGLNFPKL